MPDAVRLREEELADDPMEQVRLWFDEARASGLPMPEAMTLATSSADGRPSARIVLLHGLEANGFVFHTNYESRKGRELEVNPRAALVLYWQPLGRQIRVEGSIEQVSEGESAQYFRTRPRGGQLGAWASRQSEQIESRDLLEERVRRLDREYEGREVPLPPFWGGYRLLPDRIELWQHGEDRLHDRFAYERSGDGWTRSRLSP
ncbi:MAG TPA: pyridoxamine 5'-phosphate oxidase [Gaiellaceae bacterium]|nr:pyridoxamine 5'-phosphate oxidase [Gaiellaceae bacterium]